ncbi:hypothetical protein EPJ79_02665 [Brachyspira aalborgi]|uniref:Uncharacterized protein n=1 Tax=Brachyspira aalborgi TaxID=29522 RepID=A0A5C8D3M7_9SPIR|nr:hypothetical protein [Brachyspira aalborgi]TXJ20077.1 hypothetical protein EPJ79_02665 [Brachyspira aalborgi]
MSGCKFYNTIQYNTIQYNTIQAIIIIFGCFFIAKLKNYLKHYNYLFEKIKNNNEEYIKIIEKYFDKSIINQYLHLQKYNEIENNNLEELNYKLSPYFFYMIFIDYKIIIKLFGIRIVIKNKECSNKIIVISLSNFLRRLFSINTKKIEGKKITFLNLLGFNFKF